MSCGEVNRLSSRLPIAEWRAAWWKRPTCQRERPSGWFVVDVAIAAVLTVAAVVSYLFVPPVGAVPDPRPAPGAVLIIVILGAALAFRRYRPGATATAWVVALVSASLIYPLVARQELITVMGLILAWSLGAWEWRNRAFRIAVVAILAGATVFLSYFIGSGLFTTELRANLSGDREVGGWVDPEVFVSTGYYVLAVYLVPLAALLAGHSAYRRVHDRARLEAQDRALRLQAEKLLRAESDAERLSLSRELHDVVSQHLVTIVNHATLLRRQRPEENHTHPDSIAVIDTEAREALTNTREVITTLRSRAKDPAPIETTHCDVPRSEWEAALDSVVRRHRAHQMDVSLEVRDQSHHDLPPSLVDLAVSALEEAARNSARHSQSGRVEATLTVTRPSSELGVLDLTVNDTGPPRGATSGTQLGIVGLRERAVLLNGKLSAGPCQTVGFRLILRLPFTVEHQEADDQ